MKQFPFITYNLRYGNQYAGYADFCRRIAIPVAEKPALLADYKHPAFDFLKQMTKCSITERINYYEAFGYGDPGILLAAPSYGLCGLFLEFLQVDTFYKCYLQQLNQGKRSFFALTEPQGGSDINHLTTVVTKTDNTYYLTGEKIYIGLGAVAEIGIIFTRHGKGLQGLSAAFVDAKNFTAAVVQRTTLNMQGLQAAQIAHLSFEKMPIDTFSYLNAKYASKIALALMKTFTQLRPALAALALGQAQALLDVTLNHSLKWQYFEKNCYIECYTLLKTARKILQSCAIAIDKNATEFSQASFAKHSVLKITQQVVRICIQLLPKEIFIIDPWVAKVYADHFAWQYMEGTKHIMQQHVYYAMQREICGGAQ